MLLHIVQKDINNLNHSQYLRNAVNSKADLICFGELSTTGVLYNPRETKKLDNLIDNFITRPAYDHNKLKASKAQRLQPSQILEEIVEGLKEYSMGIMLGFPHQINTKLYNGYMYYYQGQYQVYNKINLFAPMKEDLVYHHGEQAGLFETIHGRLGIAVCYDIRFPDIFEHLAELKADIIFVPAAFPKERIEDWKRLLVQRAVDSKLPVVGINSVGNDGSNIYGGTSMVVDSSGAILASANETEEVVLEVDI